MPIRINLLAQERAAEERRRRDPVKRVIQAIGLAVALVVGLCVWYQLRLVAARSDLKNWEAQWAKLEKDHNRVTEEMKRVAEVEQKLIALHRLASNRFLWGPALNALQQTVVDNIQFVRIRSEQTYTSTDAGPPSSARPTGTPTGSAKPAASREQISLFIEAREYSASPADALQLKKLREALASFPYFSEHLRKVDGVKLIDLSPLQTDPAESDRPFVSFTLECSYPEVTRTK
jgi:hypothetical protein